MISILLDSIDRSSVINFGSVKKKDNINQQADTLEFDIIYHAGQTFRPEANSEVEMYNGASKIFGGKVHAVEKSISADNSVIYSIRAKDYSYDLDRRLVVESYVNTSVADIITAILADFTDGTFTDTNVNCALLVTKITFNRVTVTAALQKLAQLTGYSWYVDYDKDIHFFPKNTETAPFEIVDNNGNFIPLSLNVSNDLSQIRNRVFIKGGEVEGIARSEQFNGDTVKDTFRLANKFSSLPTVLVGGVAKTVGIDHLDNENDYDCFWSYSEKYIRFKATTIPGSGTNNIIITGTPLYGITVQVEDPTSIAEYGVFEFALTDKTIQSREEAIKYAKAQVEAYKDGVDEGGFKTYEDGLRSGQVITVNSTMMDVNEQFVIQSVDFFMITTTRYSYSVKLATLKTVGIIDFLIGLLESGDKIIEDTGDSTLEKTVFPQEYIEASDVVEVNTDDYPQIETVEIDEALTVQALDYDVKFCFGPMTPTGTKRVFILNGSRLG